MQLWTIAGVYLWVSTAKVTHTRSQRIWGFFSPAPSAFTPAQRVQASFSLRSVMFFTLSFADEQTSSSSSGSNGSRTPSPQQNSSSRSSSGYNSGCSTASSVSSSSSSSSSFSPPPEMYSRKVFVGGLPPDIDQGKNVFGLFYSKTPLPPDFQHNMHKRV